MFVTDWQHPAAGLQIEAFAWRSEESDKPVGESEDGALVVEYTNGDRVQFAPIRFAAYNALVELNHDPSFKSVFDSITEGVTEKHLGEEESKEPETIQDILNSEVKDAIDISNGIDGLDDNKEDINGPYWTTNETTNERQEQQPRRLGRMHQAQ